MTREEKTEENKTRQDKRIGITTGWTPLLDHGNIFQETSRNSVQPKEGDSGRLLGIQNIGIWWNHRYNRDISKSSRVHQNDVPEVQETIRCKECSRNVHHHNISAGTTGYNTGVETRGT